ncbi:MAG: minor capsid protein [Ruminococcus sp.]|nr:minor capsid protein [Ruminococcus sp.]
MIKLTFKTRPTNEIIARHGLQQGGRIQKYIDSEVTRYCEPYVPMLNGILKKSHKPATIVGSGLVTYNTPYARKQYYENKGNGEEGRNNGGLRGRLWFERMKADHKKDILKGAKEIAGIR